jgi:hypothetical protein
MAITLRKATLDDVPQIEALIAHSARGLSTGDYRPGETIEFIPMRKALVTP